MHDILVKAAAAAVVIACFGGLAAGLERENARLGAIEMCDPGWNQYGPEAGVVYKIVHQDVIEYYQDGEELTRKELTLEELIEFCKAIGFNPGR